ncbi:MAG: DUF1003 domain-containing protein [Chthonomonas sp.]|nr:DUF1003 domain-containing protein [Chthonomonas sp.]
MQKKLTRREVLRSYKARADAQRTVWARVADWMTSRFGTVEFFTLNAAWFLVWILWNVGWLGLKPFDPYPFGFLTMVVSLEAIFLSVIVLISQNRAAHIADVREEVELEISVLNESETTKVMSLLCLLLEKHGIDVSKDAELARMLRPTEESDLEKIIESELQ